MKLVFRERDSAKAKELFELAAKTDAVIITPNSRGLMVKARSYGYENLAIIEPDEIMRYAGKNFILHNIDKMIQYFFINKYNSEVIAMSATLEENSISH